MHDRPLPWQRRRGREPPEFRGKKTDVANDLSAEQLASLRDLAGPGGFTTDPEVLAPALREWRGLYTGSAACLLAPASVAQVRAVVQFCHEQRIGVVPQGGNTGLVGGGVPRHDHFLDRGGQPSFRSSTR